MPSLWLDLPACGMAAFYYWGVCMALERTQQRRIERIYGRSSGAIVGAFVLSQIPPIQLDDIYRRVQGYNRSHYIVDSWCLAMYDLLPPDAYLKCSGKLYVTCALAGLLPHTISVFRDNGHLIETLRASGCIPRVTTKHVAFVEGSYLPALDGLFVQSCHTLYRPSTTHPVLKIIVPAGTWPDTIPISARHPLSVIYQVIQCGHRDVENGSFRELEA